MEDLRFTGLLGKSRNSLHPAYGKPSHQLGVPDLAREARGARRGLRGKLALIEERYPTLPRFREMIRYARSERTRTNDDNIRFLKHGETSPLIKLNIVTAAAFSMPVTSPPVHSARLTKPSASRMPLSELSSTRLRGGANRSVFFLTFLSFSPRFIDRNSAASPCSARQAIAGSS